ncbi:cell division inhibition protein DicB [Escherichia coli]|nr:cell division inhibition protein DicB [Escherichia coli]
METLLPNVNTSEGCFEIGVTISNPVFTEDAINKRKHERELLGNDSNLLIVFYVQIMPDDFVMQLHRF